MCLFWHWKVNREYLVIQFIPRWLRSLLYPIVIFLSIFLRDSLKLVTLDHQINQIGGKSTSRAWQILSCPNDLNSFSHSTCSFNKAWDSFRWEVEEGLCPLPVNLGRSSSCPDKWNMVKVTACDFWGRSINTPYTFALLFWGAYSRPSTVLLGSSV